METTRKSLPVTVGYDGTDLGAAALDWAVDEASRRHAPLTVVLASGTAMGPTPVVPMMSPWPDEAAGDLLAGARARVAARAPRVRVDVVTSLGGPAGALIEASTSSALIVVGGPRHSKVGELFLGATAPQVAAHAHCPVVVIPESATANPTMPVVLAVDGSAASQSACELAFARAADTGRPLVAVHAWWLDGPEQLGLSPMNPEVVEQIEAGQREVAAEAVATWSAKFPEVPVEHLAVREHPVPALLAAAAHAEILVMGSRGHGGFAGLLLGSVSQGVLHGRPPCPVVVVHRGDPG